jgi:hypothetical protein
LAAVVDSVGPTVGPAFQSTQIYHSLTVSEAERSDSLPYADPAFPGNLSSIIDRSSPVKNSHPVE